MQLSPFQCTNAADTPCFLFWKVETNKGVGLLTNSHNTWNWESKVKYLYSCRNASKCFAFPFCCLQFGSGIAVKIVEMNRQTH